MIPKIIHYCWLGGNSMPKLAEKCIESWKKYCPDYEIIRWDESNLEIEKYPFMREAYEERAWAFVSDMARLQCVYKYGGIYLDTDVELLKPLDPLLCEQAYFGIEFDKGKQFDQPYVCLGLGFGSEKENPVIKELLRYYEQNHFRNDDGTLNKKAAPALQVDDFARLGWNRKNEKSYVQGALLCPSDYFDPKSLFDGKIRITHNTYSIHHYDGSWLPSSKRMRHIRMICRAVLGEKNYMRIKHIIKK